MSESIVKEKKQFMQQYVLNRALGNSYGLDGIACTQEAEKAWQEIENRCKTSDAPLKGAN